MLNSCLAVLVNCNLFIVYIVPFSTLHVNNVLSGALLFRNPLLLTKKAYILGKKKGKRPINRTRSLVPFQKKSLMWFRGKKKNARCIFKKEWIVLPEEKKEEDITQK